MPNGEDPKHYVEKILNLDSESISSDDDEGITVYPDIIVHERGNNCKNYLVIEIKKKNYANKPRKNGETYREFDFRKLKAYTKALNYTYGIYIEFEKDNICILKFFKNGEELDSA